MLKIYPFIVETLGMLAVVVTQIAKHDPDLARQLRRAASSVALNTAEAIGSHGGNERARFRSALGSNQEVRSCLDVAEAWGYVDAIEPALRDRFDRIAATLYKLAMLEFAAKKDLPLNTPYRPPQPIRNCRVHGT